MSLGHLFEGSGPKYSSSRETGRKPTHLENAGRRVVLDVPGAIRHPFVGTLQRVSETPLRARPDTRRSVWPQNASSIEPFRHFPIGGKNSAWQPPQRQRSPRQWLPALAETSALPAGAPRGGPLAYRARSSVATTTATVVQSRYSARLATPERSPTAHHKHDQTGRDHRFQEPAGAKRFFVRAQHQKQRSKRQVIEHRTQRAEY